MPFVYILFSPKKQRHYVGSCDNLQQRLVEHNENARKAFTNFTDDWEVFYSKQVSDWSTALKIEKHIKRMKSKTYLNNLSKHPEISEKLILKYS